MNVYPACRAGFITNPGFRLRGSNGFSEQPYIRKTYGKEMNHMVKKLGFYPAILALLLLAATTTARGACPGRLITLGGDITATVFALGAGECVVADDTTSEYPSAAAKLPQVGYLRSLNAEGVLSLDPDMIIASADAGPATAIRQLESAGVEVILIPEKHTVAGTIAKIARIAAILNRPQAGQKIVNRMRASLDAVNKKLEKVEQPKRVIFLLTMGGSPMAGGTGTAADGIITLAGGINAAAGFGGYKPLSAEAMVRLAPEVILVMSESTERRGGAGFVYGIPGVKLTPAGRHHRIYAIDGTLMLGFGPRLGLAAGKLAALFYPDLFSGSSSRQDRLTAVVPAKAGTQYECASRPKGGIDDSNRLAPFAAITKTKALNLSPACAGTTVAFAGRRIGANDGDRSR